MLDTLQGELHPRKRYMDVLTPHTLFINKANRGYN